MNCKPGGSSHNGFLQTVGLYHEGPISYKDSHMDNNYGVCAVFIWIMTMLRRPKARGKPWQISFV